MKTQWLFPHSYRLIGWLLFIPSALVGIADLYAGFSFDFLTVMLKVPAVASGALYKLVWWMADGGSLLAGNSTTINLTDELAALGVIAGLLMIAFSKEKVEDEMISRLRLESLQWAIYVNYIVLGVLIVFIHGGLFFNVMIYNLFTVLIVFIIRFRLSLRRNEKTVALAL